MSVPQLLLIALAAFVAAAVNAVAGGGTFLTFPTLTGIGKLPEKAANITSTLGLWPGSFSSAAVARRDLRLVPKRLLFIYCLISLAGGITGAKLLLSTPAPTFKLVIPWLLAFATLLFAFGKRIGRWAGQSHVHGKPTLPWQISIALLQLAIAIYGGYFGAGIGVLMLAGLSFTGLENLHHINALKVLLAMIINGAACVIFVAYGQAVDLNFPAAIAMAISALVGGFVGMAVARRIPQAALRGIILTIGITLTLYYFYRAYGRA